MQSLLIIGYVWPEPTATAAGSRMLQIIHQFIQIGFQVTFACPAQKQNTAFNLSGIGVSEQTMALNNSSFDLFLENLNPTIVLFDRFMMEEQFGWRVAEICPNAIRILDSEDLHFLRKARQQAIKKGAFLPREIINSEEAKREVASIYRCDVTFTISEFEMDFLTDVYKIPSYLLWYFPFIVTPNKFPKPDFKDRQDFLFIGNFMHAPNWDAVLHLKHKLWPKLKNELPGANLHVYGGYATEKVFQLQNKKERFLVHGRAESVNKVMQQVKVCLAPLRFGAGLKGKLIDAMQNNTPFVTSIIGAEGMFGAVNMEHQIAENDDDFILKATQLYNDETFWNHAVVNGNRVIKTRFDKALFEKDFKKKLSLVIDNVNKFRAENFIGSMLQHHSLKSTKYLSKWIEEKNK